jgi:hypothetical protein
MEQDEEAIIRQDSDDTITLELGGWNDTTSILKLGVQVTSLPVHGVLSIVTDSDKQDILKDQVIPLPLGLNEVEVKYKLTSTSYFNVPTIAADGTDLGLEPESVQFRLVALNADSEVAEVSPTVTQYVTVVHVNHRPVLNTPEEAVLGVADPSKAGIFDIDFDDPSDFNLDRVRVDVWANHGKLTLIQEYRIYADFDCRQGDATAWKCAGDGSGDRNMTFVAIPDNIPFILRNLAYDNLKPGTKDEVVIRISDGSGGMCLSEEEHVSYGQSLGNTFTSVRSECFQVQGTIKVPEYDADSGTGNDEDGKLNFWVRLVFWTLFSVLMFVCFCWGRKIPSCLARGQAVTPEGAEEGRAPV